MAVDVMYSVIFQCPVIGWLLDDEIDNNAQ
jgi:hypothetical protein